MHSSGQTSAQAPTAAAPAAIRVGAIERARRAIARRLTPLLALTVVVGTAGILAAPSATLAWDANTFNSSSESELYSLTNQARASAGLPSLRIDSSLAS